MGSESSKTVILSVLQTPNQQEDGLLKSLGFSPSPEGHPRKRPSEEGDEPPAKRTPLTTLDTLPPVSSSAPGNSILQSKNKMLASLLAKQPSTPTPTQIPLVPASVISATPQDKLPRIIKQQGTVLVLSERKCNSCNIMLVACVQLL